MEKIAQLARNLWKYCHMFFFQSNCIQYQHVYSIKLVLQSNFYTFNEYIYPNFIRNKMKEPVWLKVSESSFSSRLRANQITNNLVSLAWSKPHEAVTHYTLRVVDSNGRTLLDNERLEADANSYTIRELQPGKNLHSILRIWDCFIND